jgi:hypothetical protein
VWLMDLMKPIAQTIAIQTITRQNSHKEDIINLLSLAMKLK